MSVIRFPIERAIQRSDEPMRYDTDNRLMRPFACSYKHTGKTWALTIWAYDDIDAEERLTAIQQTMIVDGRIVDSGTGEFIL